MKNKKRIRIFNQNGINLLPDSKRSQVTIFIILALAIVVVLLLLFMKRGQIGISITPQTPLDSIKECASEALDNSTALISSQGGSIDPKNYYLYQGNKLDYLCYSSENYERCIMQKPLIKESVESELKKDLEPKIIDCLNIQKELLERKGYTVNFKSPNVTIELIPNNILMKIESDLSITKDKTETYKSIKIDKTSKLYELVMITSSIMNWEARYGESEIMNYMMYYPSLRVEKKKQDEGTTVYILTDKDSGDKFMFAVRSVVVPVGITGK